MSNQVYAGIPGNNMYNQNIKLIQYNPTVNPLDPLGLQGMKYTVANPSNYLNKNINSQNVNQAYTKQAQAQINQYKQQNIYANNNVNPTQFQRIIQPQAQAQQKQKIQPQIQQKYHHHNQQPQVQAKALINQKPNNVQQQQINQNQKVQPKTQGLKPNDLAYQKYAQRYPPQNPNQNQKVNLEYNKND